MNKKEYKIGYIMPIADTDGYNQNHWIKVREILDDVVNDFKMKNEGDYFA